MLLTLKEVRETVCANRMKTKETQRVRENEECIRNGETAQEF